MIKIKCPDCGKVWSTVDGTVLLPPIVKHPTIQYRKYCLDCKKEFLVMTVIDEGYFWFSKRFALSMQWELCALFHEIPGRKNSWVAFYMGKEHKTRITTKTLLKNFDLLNINIPGR